MIHRMISAIPFAWKRNPVKAAAAVKYSVAQVLDVYGYSHHAVHSR